MKFQRLFLFAGVAALTIISLGVAHGQSSRSSAAKRRIFDQVYTGARKGAATTQAEQIQKPGSYAKKNALAGTWDVVLTFGDGSQVKSTLQIMLGAAEGEGAAIHASEFSLAPPSPTLPEQGSWRYVDGSKFIASYFGYSFDEQLQPFGKIGFRHAITLGADQETFTGVAVFEVIDLTGQVLFSDSLQTAGVRHHAVAP